MGEREGGWVGGRVGGREGGWVGGLEGGRDGGSVGGWEEKVREIIILNELLFVMFCNAIWIFTVPT